jgi:hypothetical protein
VDEEQHVTGRSPKSRRFLKNSLGRLRARSRLNGRNYSAPPPPPAAAAASPGHTQSHSTWDLTSKASAHFSGCGAELLCSMLERDRQGVPSRFLDADGLVLKKND